jgi:hypothetical protein
MLVQQVKLSDLSPMLVRAQGPKQVQREQVVAPSSEQTAGQSPTPAVRGLSFRRSTPLVLVRRPMQARRPRVVLHPPNQTEQVLQELLPTKAALGLAQNPMPVGLVLIVLPNQPEQAALGRSPTPEVQRPALPTLRQVEVRCFEGGQR